MWRLPTSVSRVAPHNFPHAAVLALLKGAQSMKRFALFVSSLLLAALVVPAVRAELKEGDQAPDFELKASDGKTYKLSDLKGKFVVIAWFPKAFTPGCTTECKSMKENGEK